EGKNIIKKISDTVVDGVNTISHQARKFFGSGGGGGSTDSVKKLPVDGTQESGNHTDPQELFVTILFPTSSIWLTNVSSTEFIGNKSGEEVQVYVNGDNAQMNYSSSSAWNQWVSLREGPNQFDVYGEHRNGERTATSTWSIFLDSIPPVFSNIDIQLSQQATGTVVFSWLASDAGVGVAGYDAWYRTEDGDWQHIASSTVATSSTTQAEVLDNVALRVRSSDFAGNTSDWQVVTTTLDWEKSVVINEIAWMGTRVGAVNDEWIELYNPTDAEIDISDWSLTISGEPITWNTISSTIPAKGYYLLERTDDETLQGVHAQGMYTGAMRNSGEDLRLLDQSGNIVDEVANAQGWFAGGAYRSMERIDPTVAGSLASNWQTSDSISPMAKAQGGGYIFGSPGFQNQGYWYLVEIDEQYFDLGKQVLTLTKEDSPYFFGQGMHIPTGKKLVVESGVVLSGIDSNAYIDVAGEMVVSGSAEDPVFFTSPHDRHIVKKNVTQVEAAPSPGDWSHILIQEGATATFNHATFLYGGAPHTHRTGWIYGETSQAQVFANTGGTLALNHVSVQHTFTHDIDTTYHALIWQDGKATTTILDSSFDGGHIGIKNNSAEGNVIIRNSLWNMFTSRDGPIISTRNIPILSFNTFTNNVFNGVSINSATILHHEVLSSEQPYHIGTVTVEKEGHLEILPGTQLFMQPQASMVVQGVLSSIGSADAPITWQPQTPGVYWGSILIEGGTATFAHTTLQEGNHQALTHPQNNGMIIAHNSTVNMDHVFLSDARRPYNMFYSKNSNIRMSNSRIGWSTQKQVRGWNIDGVKIEGGALNIENTTFYGMDRGIEGYQGVTGTMRNMDGTFFVSTTLPWWPAQLFTEQ
ncbi:MAG: hypothetical protein COU33_03750, partial [Candidatus Magasanikbacteria bacterium CG10_big_fil_rev_8_21_14_0_10_43_6]